MFRLLFKYLMPLGIMLVGGIIGYNYFYGSPAEQQQSREIIASVRGLGSDIVNLLQTEKEKFDAGKYNHALDKISSAIQSLKRNTGSDTQPSEMDQLQSLELQQQSLQRSINDMNGFAPQGNSDSSITRQFETQIQQLAEQTEQLGSRLQQPIQGN